MAAVVAAGSYDAVVAPGSDQATEVLAQVAARTGQPMAANVVSAEPGDRWRITRQRWAGSLLEDAVLEGAPRFITVAPHAVAAAEPAGGGQATVARVVPPVTDADLRARVVGREVAAGAGVSLATMLEAGLNCVPVAVLFLGLGALAYALVPRASNAIAFALVGASFLWDTVLALADVPSWMLDLSPFHHVALVPAEDFDALAAVVMLAIGVLAAVAALVRFERRDLIGG